jgi:hypothetical protein
MDVRSASALSLLLGISAFASPSRATTADEKEACLSAADQGQSLRDDGKFSLARDQFLACARDVCPKLVHDQCTEWQRQLDESTPTVVFGVKDEHGNDVAAARVLADGKLITSTLDGKPVPLDPGAHDIRFERDDPNQVVTVHVVLRTGEKNRDLTASFALPEGQAGTSSEGPNASPASPEKAGGPSWTGRSVASLSVLGAGVVSVGVGAFFGLQSQNQKNQADRAATLLGPGGCGVNGMPSDPQCRVLNDARDSQNRDAILSDVLYISAGALAVGALATWFLWPKPESGPHAGAAAWVTPEVGPTHAGVRIGGAF